MERNTCRPPLPRRDERDEQIDTRARSHALDFMVAAAEVLTVMCLVKGNRRGRAAFRFCSSAARQGLFTNTRNTAKGRIWRWPHALGPRARRFWCGSGFAG